MARLADYQLAVFVSAHAVRGARMLLEGAWPAGTLIGAVGASTRTAVEVELQPDPSLVVTTPDDDQQSGSEAFWRAWRATGHRARRVLMLRAEDGRSWLSERFSENGAEVDPIAVYTRRSHSLAPGELQKLQEWIADEQEADDHFQQYGGGRVARPASRFDGTGLAACRDCDRMPSAHRRSIVVQWL